MAIEAATYKAIMARYPSGVTVVTATGETGQHAGLTLSAFSAVSLDPALVLVCVETTSNTLPAIKASGAFTVNLLGEGASAIAAMFASKDEDKFAVIDRSSVRSAPSGPVLGDDSVAYLECRVVNEVLAGDHWVFIAEVMSGEILDTRAPLLYYDRAFRAVAAFDVWS